MDFSEQSGYAQQPSPTPQKSWKKFVDQHPTALIIGSFILLPFIIFGIVLLGLRLKNGASTDSAATPTPTISISPTTFELPTDIPEPSDTPTKTTTPAKTKTPTPKLTSGVSTTPAATVTPTKQANLYFQTANCTYVPTASGSAETKLDGTTFANSSGVPATAKCDVIFQNGEDVETGKIWYMINSDSDQMKKADVGTLKKGNYPTSEYKQYAEVISLKNSTGSHEIKIELNHDKVFPESNYDDNIKSIKYTVN